MDGLSQQTEVAASPAETSLSNPSEQPIAPAEHPPQRTRPWLEREEFFLHVMVRLCIGPIVAIAPWSPSLWDRNPLFVIFPTLAIYAANGGVRGLITGLGLLTLWFALRETFYPQDVDSSQKFSPRQEQ